MATSMLALNSTDRELTKIWNQGSCVPYSVAAPMSGHHHRDPDFFWELGITMVMDAKNGQPLRASLIYNKKRGRPGAQYFEVLRSLGYTVGLTAADEFAAWKVQLDRLGVTAP